MDHILDHKERALARLIQQYRTLGTYPKVVGLFTPGVQEIEDVLWSMYGDSVDEATGAQLDVWGSIVNQARASGQDDETYRLWIKVRMLIIRSGGEADSIIQIFQFIFPECSIGLVESFPAAFRLVLGTNPPTFGSSSGGGSATSELPAEFPVDLSGAAAGSFLTGRDFLSRLLRECKAAGVRAIVQYLGADPSATFTFDSGPGWDVGILASDVLSAR